MRIVTIVLLIFPCIVYSQGLVVSADSSEVSFPNQVKISFNKRKANGRTHFQLERKDFQAFVLTTNQYVIQNSISANNVEILSKNEILLDSTVQLLEKKLAVDQERTNLYQHSYEDLKQISSSYNQQLLRCADDLRDVKKEKRRSKTRSFITGIFVGGTLGILIVGAASGGN